LVRPGGRHALIAADGSADARLNGGIVGRDAKRLGATDGGNCDSNQVACVHRSTYCETHPHPPHRPEFLSEFAANVIEPAF